MSENRPTVWYIAAGYKLPAGIEAYLLHYATEIRNHGFEPRIIVFEPLPRIRHRFLEALDARRIPIESLYAHCRLCIALQFAFLLIPWSLAWWLKTRQFPKPEWLRVWLTKHAGVRRLRKMIRDQRPDIVHVKGRLITEAWHVFPPERTIYQHALMGTVDPSWAIPELQAFRKFVGRIARVFVQSPNIARTMAREFGILRPIDVIFTMAPDEAGGGLPVESRTAGLTPRISASGVRADLRFGILCRFTEQKGIQYILEALKAFRDRHGDVIFTFAGLGPLEEQIRSFTGMHGLGNVRIVRVLSPVEVLKDMDVFVHPGLDDAMPVSIVEALMCGVPCVGSNVGGVPDLVREGVEGYIVEPASAAQILEAMERFASLQPMELMEFRRRARQRYEEACTPAVVGAIIARHYREILEECGNTKGNA